MNEQLRPEPRRQKNLTWLVIIFFAAVWGSFIHTRAYSTNDASRMASIESLVHRQTWAIDDSPFAHTLDRIKVGDSFYSTKPPVLSFAGAGIYALLHKGLGLTLQTQGCAPDLNPTHCRALLEPAEADWAYFSLTFLLAALPGILALALVYRLGWRFGLPNWLNLGLVAVLGLGTAVFPFSVVFVNHVPAAAALVAALYLIMTRPQPGKRPLWMIGFFAALAVSLDLSSGVYFIAILVYSAIVYRRDAVWVALGAIIPALLTAVLDYQIIGSLLPPQFHTAGYQYEGSVIEARVAGHRQADNVFQYIFRLFVGDYGLFSFYPIVFLYGTALFAALRSRQKNIRYTAVAVAAATLAYIAYFSFDTYSFGGFAFGVRWLLIPIPLLALFAQTNPGLYRPRWRIGLWGVLALVSIWGTYPGALNPWNPAYPPFRLVYAPPEPRQYLAAVVSGYQSFDEVDPAIRQGFGVNHVLRRWVDARQGMVVPDGPAWWFIHESTPPAPQLAGPLGLGGAGTFALQADLHAQAERWLSDFSQGYYRSDRLVPDGEETAVPAQLPATFSGEDGDFSLLGAQWEQTDDTLSLITAWRVETRSLNKPAPRRVFVHVLAQNGAVAAQNDYLAADYASLFPGDLFFQIQTISLNNLPPGDYWVQLGLYNPDTGARFLLDDAADRVLLTRFQKK